MAPAVGTFCCGARSSDFRQRTNAAWLLAGIHPVGELMFKVTKPHVGALWGFLVRHAN